jgi:nucleoside 2-deoxyribosyltransferase
MRKQPFCFVVMPFRAELNFVYLFLQRYLSEKHGLRVERGDHRVLTKALMDKVREQIVEADVVLADVTGSNPNVFYEIGLAQAIGRPVIFMTQDPPENAPVDIRQFEFIRYDLSHHDELLVRLDNAVQNVFVGKYRVLFDEAVDLLKRFNLATSSALAPSTLEEFQARVMRGEQMQDIPDANDLAGRVSFLLPKILKETSELTVMRKVMEWTATFEQQVA